MLSLRILTKIQLHELYKTSAAKCGTNSSFKILPELRLQNLDQDSTLPLQNISNKILTKFQLQMLPEFQLQNLDQTSYSQSEQKFNFMTKPQLPNLQQTPTQSSSSTSATVTTLTSFELASSKARVTPIKFTNQESVSQLVSQLVTDKHNH